MLFTSSNGLIFYPPYTLSGFSHSTFPILLLNLRKVSEVNMFYSTKKIPEKIDKIWMKFWVIAENLKYRRTSTAGISSGYDSGSQPGCRSTQGCHEIIYQISS